MTSFASEIFKKLLVRNSYTTISHHKKSSMTICNSGTFLKKIYQVTFLSLLFIRKDLKDRSCTKFSENCPISKIVSNVEHISSPDLGGFSNFLKRRSPLYPDLGGFSNFLKKSRFRRNTRSPFYEDLGRFSNFYKRNSLDDLNTFTTFGKRSALFEDLGGFSGFMTKNGRRRRTPEIESGLLLYIKKHTDALFRN